MTRKRPSFGFAEMANILPPAQTTSGSALSETFEAVAARLGFVSREPFAAKPSPVLHSADTIRFTVEAKKTDRDVFIAYCHENKLTEQQAFSRLVARLEN